MWETDYIQLHYTKNIATSVLQKEMTQRCPEWDWATEYLKNLRDYAKVRKIVFLCK